MERQPTIEDLLNKIKLMEKVLEFYGDDNNYNEKSNLLILRDNGHQARFVLDQIASIKKYEETLFNEMKEVIKNLDNENDDIINNIEKTNELIKLLNKYKK